MKVTHSENLNRLNILLILAEYPPSVGGMQTHAIYLTQYLSNLNCDIEVVTYQATTKEEILYLRAEDAKRPFSVNRVLSRIGFMHNIQSLLKIIRRSQPDLIYSSTVFYGCLESLTGIPVVCRSVGNDILRPWIVYPFTFLSQIVSFWRFEHTIMRVFRKISHPLFLESLFRNTRFKLMKRSARMASLILANSDFTHHLLRHINVRDSNIRILVGGVDYDRFSQQLNQKDRKNLRTKLNIPENAFVIMTSGRLVKKKGVDFLIRAFAGFTPPQRNWYLLIVGDGKARKKYERLAHKLRINNNVVFTGAIPHLEIHTFYKSSDIFVLASRIIINKRSGAHDTETMGRVLCEANAAGIPVIATNSGGIPSVIKDGFNGLLFTPEDSDGLLDCILQIEHNYELRKSLIANGKNIAKNNFDWSVIIREHIRHFSELTISKATSSINALEALRR
ncbi:MAG: glycosyltransferase family 4 protein [Candidatus Hodarchaeales archaeon]